MASVDNDSSAFQSRDQLSTYLQYWKGEVPSEDEQTKTVSKIILFKIVFFSFPDSLGVPVHSVYIHNTHCTSPNNIHCNATKIRDYAKC